MPEGHTVTIEVDGESRDVELPDGYIPEDQVRESFVPKENVETIVQDRLKRATKGRHTKDELLEDEDFLKTVATERGDALKEILGVKGSDDPDVEALRKERAQLEQRATSLETENETLHEERNRLRERALDADIQEAMSSAHIVDEDDVRDLVPLWVRQQMEYDPELGRHVAVDKDGNVRYATTETGEAVPMGAKELLQEEAKAGRHKGWFKDLGRDGAGFGGSRSSQGRVSLEQFENMSGNERDRLHRENPELYRRLQSERQRAAESKLYGAA